MRKEFLPFSLPTIGEEEIREVTESLKSGWITTGPKTKKFEQEFAELKRVKHAVALNSCTAALHLALHILSLRPGDEVITSVNTFAATANVIIQCGAKPVLADTEKDTMNLDPEDVRRKITGKTKAVIPVHLAGHAADLSIIRSLCNEKGLVMIQDAAHAVDSLYDDNLLEKYGDMVCYSFYATKAITTAEGGMLTTDSDEYADRVRINGLHGMSRDAWKRYQKGGSHIYDIVTPGFKYNLTDIQSGIGLAQLKKMPDFLEARRTQAGFYTRELSDLSDYLIFPAERKNCFHSYHLYMIRLKLEKLKCSRDEFIAFLAEQNIGTSVHFIPLNLHSYYRDTFGLKKEDFPAAMDSFERVISLPLYPRLTEEDQNDVCEAVRNGIEKFRC